MNGTIPTDVSPHFAIAEMVRHYDEHGRYPDAALREHAIEAFGPDVLVSILTHALTRAITANRTTVEEWVAFEVERTTEGMVEDLLTELHDEEEDDER